MYDRLENCSIVEKLGKKIFKAEVALILTDKGKYHWYDNFEHHMLKNPYIINNVCVYWNF